MKIIEQSHEVLEFPTLKMIEKAGRTCYKSENKITQGSALKFVKMLRDRGHHAMIEFGDIVVRFVTNRGVTHELVRHRLCSFAQESTRYVRYDGGMEFIRPVWCDEKWTGVTWSGMTKRYKSYTNAEMTWADACLRSEIAYINLITDGWRPEQAREILPNSLKTEIVVKANIREWRHLLTLRTSKAAHPQIRVLMLPLLDELKEKIPIVFDDI